MHRKDSEEHLTEKVQSLFGKTTNMKLQRLKIMIVGLESVGLEVALHLVPLQPETITFVDQNLVQVEDLDINCAFKQHDVDKNTRAKAAISYLN